TFYRKGALFSIPFGFYWIINTPDMPSYSHVGADRFKLSNFDEISAFFFVHLGMFTSEKFII
ncbi:hypothetical protein, partial [Geobacillus kaustophilus]|uniref:hypothetical protein n=1 Tax=Geobacillus kaustophilus TaxID=1462 RepID=UPI0005CD58E1